MKWYEKMFEWIGFLVFQQYFSYIVDTSFSGGGSRREPPTMGKQLVNFRLRVERTIFVIYKAGLEMFEMPWNKHKNKKYMYLTQTEHTRKKS